MAIATIDGFDAYNGVGANTGLFAKWYFFDGLGASYSMTAGRLGGQALRLQGGSNFVISRPFATPVSTATIGCAVRITYFRTGDGSGNPATFIALWNGSNPQCNVKFNGDGSISAYRQSGEVGGVLLGTSAVGTLLFNTWQFLEVEYVISTTVGRVTIYLDGNPTPVLNLTNQNTQNYTTAATATQFLIGSQTSFSGSATQWDCDDLYVLDTAARLGPCRVETLYPSADVAAGFTRSSGTTNFSMVREAQCDGDTTYVQTSTAGTVDTYDFNDLSTTPLSIYAVQLGLFGEKTDIAARALALQVVSGATTQDGADQYLAGSYARYERILPTDPNTSAAWSTAAVNALRAGPKVTV